MLAMTWRSADVMIGFGDQHYFDRRGRAARRCSQVFALVRPSSSLLFTSILRWSVHNPLPDVEEQLGMFTVAPDSANVLSIVGGDPIKDVPSSPRLRSGAANDARSVH